jgi:4-amino-4-deoxychorismate lyase
MSENQTYIIINGEICAHIDAHDRGLQYGDGVFETIAVKNNKLLFWRDHLTRLAQACKTLHLPVINEQQWLEDIRALNINSASAVIKLILTRGAGGRGYRFPDESNITRIVSVYAWPEYPQKNTSEGIKAIFCKTRISTNSTLAGIKHLNRLENVLARNEWRDDTIAEGLMLDDEGHVIEGTMSNIFAVNKQVLYTPKLHKSGVKGVLRKNIISLAQACNIEVRQSCLTKDALLDMDELFISNSIIGIWPIVELDGKHYKPGKLTSVLINKLDATKGAQEI